jgi:hypothetical protein
LNPRDPDAQSKTTFGGRNGKNSSISSRGGHKNKGKISRITTKAKLMVKKDHRPPTCTLPMKGLVSMVDRVNAIGHSRCQTTMVQVNSKTGSVHPNDYTQQSRKKTA